MNLEPLKTARAELADTLASLDKVITFYEAGQRLVATAVGRAYVAPTTRAMAKTLKVGNSLKPEPPRISARTRVSGRGETTELFRVVVDKVAEPFTVASTKAAFLAAHPEKEKWTVNVAGALYRWMDEGALERTSGGGTGNPSSYRRTKRWGTPEAAKSQKERAYQEFRSTIATPAKPEEE